MPKDSMKLHDQTVMRGTWFLLKRGTNQLLGKVYQRYSPAKGTQYLEQTETQYDRETTQNHRLLHDEEPAIQLNSAVQQMDLPYDHASLIFQYKTIYYNPADIARIAAKERAAKKSLTDLARGNIKLSTCRTFYNFFCCRKNLRKEIENAEACEQSYAAAWYNISGEMAPRN